MLGLSPSLSLSLKSTPPHMLQVQFTLFLNTSHGLLFLPTHHDLFFHWLLIILHIYIQTGSNTFVHVIIPLIASFTTSSIFLHMWGGINENSTWMRTKWGTKTMCFCFLINVKFPSATFHSPPPSFLLAAVYDMQEILRLIPYPCVYGRILWIAIINNTSTFHMVDSGSLNDGSILNDNDVTCVA